MFIAGQYRSTEKENEQKNEHFLQYQNILYFHI